MHTERVIVAIDVTIGIDSDHAPLDLFSRVETSEWRKAMYDMTGRAEVLRHWAYNAVVNNVHDISRLDGWADVPRDIVTMRAH